MSSGVSRRCLRSVAHGRLVRESKIETPLSLTLTVLSGKGSFRLVECLL